MTATATKKAEVKAAPIVKAIPRDMVVRGKGYTRFPATCGASGRPIVRFQEVRVYREEGAFYHDGTPVPKGAPGPWASPQYHRIHLFDQMMTGPRTYLRTRRPNRDKAIQAEINQFRADGKPAMAALLEERHPEVPEFEMADTIIKLGETHVSMTLPNMLQCHGEEVASFLVRHSEGDFGLLGKLSDLPKPSEEDIWSEGWLADRPTANAVAIATGAGWVYSVFSLYRPIEDLAKPSWGVGVDPFRRDKQDQIKILTILDPELPPRTFVYSNKDNVAGI